MPTESLNSDDDYLSSDEFDASSHAYNDHEEADHDELGIEDHEAARSESRPLITTSTKSSTSPVRRRDHDSSLTTALLTDASDDEYEKESKIQKSQVKNSLLHFKKILISFLKNPIISKVLSLLASLLFILLLKKLMKPELLHSFLIWMETHPIQGLLAYLVLYPLHMILILPGTPLCMGAGFVFKVQYGWFIGVAFCSLITLLGSLLGSVICFLLGRHCFQTKVRRYSKKYPMFDPIDKAVASNGFKIMCLIYLTPAVPLGPMSYMMGTTSMDLMDFALAKIAHAPITVLYIYLGAATGTLMLEDESGNSNAGTDGEHGGSVHKANMDEMSLNPQLAIGGILFSIMTITYISIKMKKELQKVCMSLPWISFTLLCTIYSSLFTFLDT